MDAANSVATKTSAELCNMLRKGRGDKAAIVAELEKRLPTQSLTGEELFLLLKHSLLQDQILNMLYAQKEVLSASDIFNLIPFFSGREKEALFTVFKAKGPQLTGHQLCSLHSEASKSPDQTLAVAISVMLYERLGSLEQLELIYLAKSSAIGAPKEFTTILETIFQNELTRMSTLAADNASGPCDKLVALSLPNILQCKPHLPVRSSDVGQTLQWFSPFPESPSNACYLDVVGDMVSLAHLSFNVVLCKTLPLTKAAAVYLTLLSTTDKSIFVGYMTNTVPLLHLPYPFPVFGSVQNVRIGIKIVDVADALKEAEKAKKEVITTATTTTTTTISSSPNTATPLVVCYGEIHSFPSLPGETMASITERSCSRWSLLPSEYEILDIDFRAYPDDMTFQEYLSKGGPLVLRLKKKNVYGGLTFPGAPQQQQPVQPLFPFAPASPGHHPTDWTRMRFDGGPKH